MNGYTARIPISLEAKELGEVITLEYQKWKEEGNTDFANFSCLIAQRFLNCVTVDTEKFDND